MTAAVDIVIPVYNEGKNILVALERIKAELRTPYRILVVYDMDSDTSLAAIQNGQKDGSLADIPIVPTKNIYGRGALNAIKTGLKLAQAEYVVVTMADLSDPPSVINEMIAMAQNQGADLVCASRYMRGGQQIGGPLLKKTMSRLAGVSLRYMIGFPTHDVTNSFKLYRRSMLEAITIESQGGFELGMEIVVKAWQQGFSVKEVPTVWRDRTDGASRFRLFQWLPSYLHWYFVAIKERLSFGPRSKKA